MYLTSWVDKISASCMYSTNHMCIWSASHLKEDCWYLECGRTICPIEEEDVKATCDKANPKGVMPVPDVVVVLEELSLADIALLLAKERNRILSQKAKVAKKVERVSAKATAIVEKEAKKDEKTRKSKVIISQTETSSHKRDSTFAELLVSDCSSLHYYPSRIVQGGLSFWMSFSSLHLLMPLHPFISSTMPSQRNGLKCKAFFKRYFLSLFFHFFTLLLL